MAGPHLVFVKELRSGCLTRPHLAVLGPVPPLWSSMALLQLTVERNITASHLTLGLVAEMASLVFVTI